MPTKNLVTDYGAVSGGAEATNQTAFDDYRTFARGQSSNTLIIPAGSYAITGGLIFDGIPALTVNATGATITFSSTNGMRLGTTGGFVQRDPFSARIAAVAVGATSLTCLTPSDASIFPVGRRAAIAALEAQGATGYPPSHQYLNYVRIVSANATSGVVTFTPGTTLSFSVDYPVTSVTYDIGGPVTLFLMDHPVNGDGSLAISWGVMDTTVNGLTIVNGSGQSSGGPEQVLCNGYRITTNDVTTTGCSLIPSQNKYFIMNRYTTNSFIEHDKQVEFVEYNSCSLTSTEVQSSSVRSIILDATSVSGAFNGTPHTMVIRNGSTLSSLKFGPTGYGSTNSVTIADSTVSAQSFVTSDRVLESDFSRSVGSMVYAGAEAALKYFAPNSLIFYSGSSRTNAGRPSASVVTDVKSSGTAAKVLSNLLYPAPTMPSEIGAPLYIMQSPCPSLSVSNSIGCPEMVEWSRAPQGNPIYSYGWRSGSFATGQGIEIWGRLVSFRVNVITPYTGTQPSLTFYAFGEVLTTANAWARFSDFNNNAAPLINAKVAGERIITPTTVSGAQSGDSISAAGTLWFIESVTAQLSANVSGEGLGPVIEFEIITDQGVPPPVTVSNINTSRHYPHHGGH